jgi:hypothetical protein
VPYLKDTGLSSSLLASIEAAIDACCAAWNQLLAGTGRSLASFEWASQVKVQASWHQTPNSFE